MHREPRSRWEVTYLQSPGAILPLVPAQQVSVGMTTLLCITAVLHSVLISYGSMPSQTWHASLPMQHIHVAQPPISCCAAGTTGQSRHDVLSACEAVLLHAHQPHLYHTAPSTRTRSVT